MRSPRRITAASTLTRSNACCSIIVVGDNPEALTFFLIADVEEYVAGPVTDSTENWPRKAYITRAVKQRLHQQRFRSLVLAAYRERCAMCRLKHASLLDAAHILPDRDVRGNPEVPNGLALRLPRRAFREVPRRVKKGLD